MLYRVLVLIGQRTTVETRSRGSDLDFSKVGLRFTKGPPVPAWPGARISVRFVAKEGEAQGLLDALR